MNTGIFQAPTKEIKENIYSAKEDFMESFRRVLDNFKQESFKLDQKIESIKQKNLEGDGTLQGFDSKMTIMRGKLKDSTNKIPKILKKIRIFK